jgi:hypothetical protein
MEENQHITRKEALKKVGKYAAFTAAAMMLILEPVYGADRPPKKSPKPPRLSTAHLARRHRPGPPPSF